MTTIERVLGPRVPAAELHAHRGRYALPTLLFAAAAVLLVISLVLPYWQMTLHAPQYPHGLRLRALLTRLDGDVREIDGLNHYIGMRHLGEAAQFERSVAVMAVTVLSLLVLASTFVHNRWAAALAFPALFFPVAFLVDLQLWLADFGTHLDPHAPLSTSVKPFVPPVLGVGKIGQFRTVALPDVGLWLAVGAAAVLVVGLWSHRRAYKPLVDALVAGSESPRS
ncbi:MAG: cytochrome C [bacterium]